MSKDLINELQNKLDRNQNLTKNHDSFLKPGWVQVFPENLPSKGRFYPDNIKIHIHSGDGKDVIAWSMIDETDLISVHETMNNILHTRCEVLAGSTYLSWKDICEEDRFVLLLMIRDLTFPEPENVLTSPVKCSCDKGSIEVKKDNLELFSIDDKYEKYYDSNKKYYLVKTKTYGDFEMRPPSIGCSIGALEYIKRCRQRGINIDTSLLKIIPYMCIDWRNMNETFVKEIEADMLGWDAKKTSIILKIIDDMKTGPNMQLKGGCRNCGSEVECPITFLGGLKTIFDIQNLDSELA